MRTKKRMAKIEGLLEKIAQEDTPKDEATEAELEFGWHLDKLKDCGNPEWMRYYQRYCELMNYKDLEYQ